MLLIEAAEIATKDGTPVRRRATAAAEISILRLALIVVFSKHMDGVDVPIGKSGLAKNLAEVIDRVGGTPQSSELPRQSARA